MPVKHLKRPPVFREDGTIEIHLQRGYIALIDVEDAHLAHYNWTANVTPQGNVYAQRTTEDQRAIGLHREVLGLSRSRKPDVDHLDGDTLNCRRHNVRARTRGENLRNRPTTKGVTYHKRDRRWRAYIDGDHLGCFRTRAEAVAARLAAERERWGIEPRRAHLHALWFDPDPTEYG